MPRAEWAGPDKFYNRLVNWEMYVAPFFARITPGGARNFMGLVGAIEVSAGVLSVFRPRLGGYVVAGWLGGIIGNLLVQREYHDIALRDFGLLLGALSLGRLGKRFSRE